MNVAIKAGLATGGAGLALGVGSALLETPKDVPHDPRNAWADMPRTQPIWLGLLGGMMMTGLAGTAMALSMGKGFAISPKLMALNASVAGGFAAATAGTMLALQAKSRVD